jgi:signal transduction histidine kinase
MSFDDLVLPQLGYSATRSARDFMGITGNTEICEWFPKTLVPASTTNLDSLLRDERLAERTRIAQELHDTLMQGFLAVSLQLQVAVECMPSDYAEKARFSNVLQLVDRVLAEGRSALQGLRSPNCHAASLGEALARVPSDLGFASAAGCRVVVLGKEKELKPELLEEVYRIGREAIVNACRHSRAKEIETEVEFSPTELRIAVRDNGCGIADRNLHGEQNGHWGLQGMRERADRIGAQLRLWSRAALGTEVELCVPGRVAFAQMESRATQ